MGVAFTSTSTQATWRASSQLIARSSPSFSFGIEATRRSARSNDRFATRRSLPTCSSRMQARAAPPAPSAITSALLTSMPAPSSPLWKPMRSVLWPMSRPPRQTIVFTAPIRRASSSTSSTRRSTVSLYGIVTFAPSRSSSRRSRSRVAPSWSSAVSLSSYRCGSPSFANAVLCIAGESECATGRPMSQTWLICSRTCSVSASPRRVHGWPVRWSRQRRSSLISVLYSVRLVLREGRREGVVAGPVVLRDEVEVRNLRRLGRAFESLPSGAADRGRREPRDLVRVVRRIDLEVGERWLAPHADRVLHRGICVELHPDRETVRVHASDGRAFLAVAGLSLDDRSELHDVVDRRLAVNRSLSQGLARPLFELVEQRVDDLGCRRGRLEEVRVGEEEALEGGVRRQPREHRVLALPDHSLFHEIVPGDRGEGLPHRGRRLAQAPPFD